MLLTQLNGPDIPATDHGMSERSLHWYSRLLGTTRHRQNILDHSVWLLHDSTRLEITENTLLTQVTIIYRRKTNRDSELKQPKTRGGRRRVESGDLKFHGNAKE